jgi:Protein of unknown function (DUF1501)
MTSTPLNPPANRREFLEQNAMGLGAMALAWLLNEEGRAAAPHIPKAGRSFDLTAKAPPSAPRARAMISLFMHGGPSHVDLYDPKPELTAHSGEDYAGEVVYSFVNRASKKLLGSPWKFEKRGQCGTEISELLPNIAGIVDDIALIRSAHTGHNGHEVSIRFMHAGRAAVTGRPTLGSWLTYGLGSESQNLPAYVVLSDPAGNPVDGAHNWSNGWLPSIYQGTVVRPREPRILNLDPPPHLKGDLQRQNLDLLQALNRRHLARNPGETDLEARIASYELAARMQSSAKEALDITGETEATLKLYGIDQPATQEYGTRCLIARRLIERVVRFVQIFLGGQPWDNHTDIRNTLPAICQRTDRPSAALVLDLKNRGLLDTTLVHWGGEIGRLPVTEGDPATCGRDHNGQGFSMWLAGGGIKGGVVHGQTDEVGHKAVTDIVTPNDYQATVLNLFGLDHQKLVFHHNGQEQKLTEGRGQVLAPLLA